MLKLGKVKCSTKMQSYSTQRKSTQEGGEHVISETSVQGKPQQPLPGPSRRNCESLKKQLVVKELKN